MRRSIKKEQKKKGVSFDASVIERDLGRSGISFNRGSSHIYSGDNYGNLSNSKPKEKKKKSKKEKKKKKKKKKSKGSSGSSSDEWEAV